jgi:hypothetical protein
MLQRNIETVYSLFVNGGKLRKEQETCSSSFLYLTFVTNEKRENLVVWRYILEIESAIPVNTVKTHTQGLV